MSTTMYRVKNLEPQIATTVGMLVRRLDENLSDAAVVETVRSLLRVLRLGGWDGVDLGRVIENIPSPTRQPDPDPPNAPWWFR
jgi:hypothetical protein